MEESKHGKILLEWTFPEFHVHERGTAWYFWMTLVGGALVLMGLFSRNYLFALIVVLVAILLALFEHRGPRSILVQVTEDGIVFNGALVPYAEFRDFRIVYHPPKTKALHLTFTNVLRPRRTLDLMGMNPLDVRAALVEYLLEDIESDGEPIGDQIARLLKL